MPARPKFKDGQYKIECAICGCEMYSAEMTLGKDSNLPMHSYHAEENSKRYPVLIKEQRVPDPQSNPDDKFQSFDVAHTPTPLTYD